MPHTVVKSDSAAIQQYHHMLKSAEGQDALHEGNVRRAFETLESASAGERYRSTRVHDADGGCSSRRILPAGR